MRGQNPYYQITPQNSNQGHLMSVLRFTDGATSVSKSFSLFMDGCFIFMTLSCGLERKEVISSPRMRVVELSDDPGDQREDPVSPVVVIIMFDHWSSLVRLGPACRVWTANL
ncbi:hypothetical protein RRG08_044930 [Elysia crispata]|uniref:Uncharacterized protein n=1 Tax=Elysia crispata TaxID=231223 RepID=A0AAE0ZTD1_9GAST|nr:hypothetical protein RRG08_044930 [Elysia crispata]